MMKRFLKLFSCVSVVAAAITLTGTNVMASDNSEQITISFWEHIADVEHQAPQVWDVVQTYMELHPNVTIEINGAEIEEHSTRLKLAAQSDSLPDLFYSRTPAARDMIKEGLIADLTDDLTSDEDFMNGFLSGMTDVLNIDGRIYGIPAEIQANGIWYNKALFDQCGLEIPETYDELLNCCKVLRENGITPMARGTKDSFAVWCLTNMFCRFGFYDHIDNILAGEDKWNNEDFIKFFEKLEEMTAAGMWPDNVTSLGYAEAKELFVAGNAAMLDSGVWDTGTFDSSEFKDSIYFNWGPTFSDGVGNQEVSMKAASFPYCVSAKVKEEDPEKYAAIIDFLKFYYGPEGTKIIVENNQCVAITTYDVDIDAEEHPVFVRVLEKINDDWESPTFAPNMYLPGDLEPTYHDAITGVLNGVYTPEEACDYLDTQMIVLGLLD